MSSINCCIYIYFLLTQIQSSLILGLISQNKSKHLCGCPEPWMCMWSAWPEVFSDTDSECKIPVSETVFLFSLKCATKMCIEPKKRYLQKLQRKTVNTDSLKKLNSSKFSLSCSSDFLYLCRSTLNCCLLPTGSIRQESTWNWPTSREGPHFFVEKLNIHISNFFLPHIR